MFADSDNALDRSLYTRSSARFCQRRQTRAAVKLPSAPPWASRNRCELQAACPQRSSNGCALPLLTEKPLACNCPGTDRAEEPYAFVIGQEQRLFEHERQFAMALRASGANVADRSFAFSDDPRQAHTFQAHRGEHLWKRSDASSIV
jgi:hypothetical protein